MTFVDQRLAANPRRPAQQAHLGELGHLRIAPNGDYRVPFCSDDDPDVIWVVRVDHRANAYRHP
jgi:mRNA-degrading endonuclease RelE of RelBE toxin-antitoxin system